MKDHRFHEKDARITIYTYCIDAIDSALLYLIFRNYELPTDTWWDSLPKKFEGSGISKHPIPKPSSLELLKKEVDHYWTYSFFILLFSSLESSARIIVRATHPGKFNDGRSNMKDILKCLLATNFSNYECLLELLRLGRNTMHNNGVYFPEKKMEEDDPPVVVQYKGTDYKFIDGQVVQYGDLPKLLFFDIAPEMLSMINDIVHSQDVLRHPNIRDPGAYPDTHGIQRLY
ncbi:MAG: hypothetical protein WAM14_03340 [Candidatus Nitrosopolaris sp.]